MRRVMAALGTELVQLDPVWVVAPVLLGDVVTLFALGAREGDLGSNVGRLAHNMHLSSKLELTLTWDLLELSCRWCSFVV